MQNSLNDQEVRKADKKELLDTRHKILARVEEKIDKQEAITMVNDFSKDSSQKQLSFRKELFEKIKDIQQDITESIASFVHESDFRHALDAKADQQLLTQICS